MKAHHTSYVSNLSRSCSRDHSLRLRGRPGRTTAAAASPPGVAYSSGCAAAATSGVGRLRRHSSNARRARLPPRPANASSAARLPASFLDPTSGIVDQKRMRKHTDGRCAQMLARTLVNEVARSGTHTGQPTPLAPKPTRPLQLPRCALRVRGAGCAPTSAASRSRHCCCSLWVPTR